MTKTDILPTEAIEILFKDLTELFNEGATKHHLEMTNDELLAMEKDQGVLDDSDKQKYIIRPRTDI